MDADEVVIGQIGLLLTQMRQARRALEEIERNTARYTGFAFAPLLAAGASFGAPPLLNGALKVYVVNINDLAPGGRGLGGFFSDLLSGIGGFIGGLGGGFLGGLLGGAALPYNLAQLRRIVEALGPIVREVHAMRREALREPAGAEGPSWLERLPELTALTRALTVLLPPLTDLVRALGANLPSLVGPIERLFGLFTAHKAPQGPGQPDARAVQEPPTDWVAVIGEMARLVDGLILLLPIAVGGLASLIVHLRDVQRSITDLLTWALRMTFLLRGAMLVVIYDTVAAGARAAVEVLAILGRSAERIMSAAFTGIERGLVIALDLLRALGAGLSRTLETLLNWLVSTLFQVLTDLGRLRVFQLVFRIVDAGNTFMSMLHRIITGHAPPPPVSIGLPAMAAAPPGAATPIRGPDLAEALAPAREVADLAHSYSQAAATTFREIRDAAGGARSDLQGLASSGARQAREAAFAAGPLQEALGNVRARANDLGEAMERAREPVGARVPTGLETVARAYEDWLQRGGMADLLASITAHFQATPLTGPPAAASIPGQVVTATAEAAERARATVRIEDLVIVVDPPGEPSPAGPQSSLDREELLRWLEGYSAEIEVRT